MAQQTAVEWIAEKMEKLIPPGNQIAISIMLHKAKEMEKEQIIKSNRDGVDMAIDKKRFITGEQYYNEKYGNK